MIVGNPDVFAIESEITYAYESRSQRALGYFVIHIGGRRYGVKAWDATMLGASLDGVAKRIAGRGSHQAEMISTASASEIAMAYRLAVYSDEAQTSRFFGLSADEFGTLVHSKNLVWAPDGDEAFDDGCFILQFDVENRVRLVAFSRSEIFLVDHGSLHDIWMEADEFYGILREWHTRFGEEWISLPKFSGIIQ